MNCNSRRRLFWHVCYVCVLALVSGFPEGARAQTTGFLLWELSERELNGLDKFFEVPNGDRSPRFPFDEMDLYPSTEILAILEASPESRSVFEIPIEREAPRRGLRLRGYLHPPVTGPYKFRLSTDDGGWLLFNPLGPDPEFAQPVSKVRVSSFRTFEVAGSIEHEEPFQLEQGERYFIEVLNQNSGGLAHLSVQWERPDGIKELIPLQYIEPFSPDLALDIVVPDRFHPARVDYPLEAHFEHAVGLVDSLELLVDGNPIHRLGREVFEPFERTDLSAVVPIVWREPEMGRHVVSLRATDVLGNIVVSSVAEVEITPDCHGLRAEFIVGLEPGDVEPIRSQIDSVVDFDWVSGTAPTVYTMPPGVPAELFSVRWTGYLRVDETGGYQISTTSDDGSRLWVDDVLVIDDWSSPENATREGTIELPAGDFVPLTMEYFQGADRSAGVQLKWRKPDGVEEVIPNSNLYYCPDERPELRLVAPGHREQVPAGAPVPLHAIAMGLSDAVETVEFFVDGNLAASVSTIEGSNHYEGFWLETVVGIHRVTAVATDTMGRTMRVAEHQIEVSEALPSCLETVYRTDFEDGVDSVWSYHERSTTPRHGNQFLGPLSGGSEPVELALTGLTEHSELSVEFDLYLLRSWDGSEGLEGFPGESWEVVLESESGDHGFEFTFANLPTPLGRSQSFPKLVGAGVNNPPLSGAVEINSLGYFYSRDNPDTQPLDSVYRIRLPLVDHTSDTFSLMLQGNNLERGNDEGWGIDNVVIRSVATSEVPVMVQSPEDRNGEVGEVVVLEALANSAGLVRYQWYKDGVALVGGEDGRLRLDDIQLEDAGSYVVEAINCVGLIRAEAIVLSVAIPNGPPRLEGLPGDIALAEDSGLLSVPFTVLDDRDALAQLEVSLSVLSGVLDGGQIILDLDGGDSVLVIAPGADVFGNSEVVVRVEDSAGLMTEQVVRVQVMPVNDPPTLEEIADVVLFEEEGPFSIPLNGISSGAGNESQVLTVSARSLDPALLPDPFVDYQSPAAEGALRLQPRAEQFGSTQVIVTVTDGGSEVAEVSRRFGVTVEQRPNVLPRIHLVNEVPSREQVRGEPVLLEYEAIDPDGELAEVVLLVNGVVARRLVMAPYQFEWIPEELGTQEIRARAVDDRSGRAETEPLVLTIVPPNQAPEITAPLEIQLNEDFGRREFLFEIVDDRTAASNLVVEVLLDGSARNLVHEPEIRRSGSGWTLSLQSIKNAFGEGGLEISAIDTAGLSGRLLVPLVVASVNDVPSVRILTPRSGETFPVGTTTRVEVDVIDPDSDIEKAEFYVDSVLSATVRNAPYSVVLENDSPGERFVEVIVQDLAGDRSEVRSLNYDVVPPPLRETVSLNAPLVGADYCVGTPIQFLAAVSFSDAEINRVEFFADETLLGFDEEFPYELTWRQPMSGTLSLKAVAVKQDGETIVSESRRIFVQAACDGTVVITAGESGEIETVLDYLFEMGIAAVAIDQTEVSEAILRRFDLMIVHVGHAGALADATISLLSRLRRTGETIEDQRSMYFIGSHLSSEGQRWDLGVATIWSSLVGLTSSEKSLVPGTVEAVGEEGLEDLLAGPFGEMGSFDYSLDVEDARAADGADVLLRSGLTDLAVAQPSLDLVDLNVPRILSQNFHLRVADDVAGNLERKRFFQNSVCWLLHCNACGSADLRVELQEGDNRTNPGGIVRQLRVVNRGTCPALSARVVGRLPAGLELVAVTSIRHILWRQKLDSGEFSVLLGDLPPGFEGEVSLEFELNDAVQIRENVDWEICAEANNSETLCLTTMLANMGGRPPQLRLERVGNDFLLSVATEVGAAYRLETSVDLREWVPIDWQSGSLGAWTVPVANGTGSEARFYRLARQP